MSIAEKALHELDVYKTPLLPTRLKNSKGVPDIFQPKKARHLILMQDKDDNNARLGVPGKKKSKKNRINGTKPYAGEGGMKKLLARRKMEEGEGKGVVDGSKSQSEDDGESKPLRRQVEDKIPKPDVPSVDRKELEPPSRSSYIDPGGRPQSSLRVGRTKTNRSHLARPPRPANRFSAAFADDDGDDQMQDDSEPSKEQLMLEEAAKKVPVFEIKPGFTFAKEEVSVATLRCRRRNVERL
jgi:nucleoporin NUP1